LSASVEPVLRHPRAGNRAAGRSVLDDFKTAYVIALQVERFGMLHYLVLETDK
jgi:hypothetical protein